MRELLTRKTVERRATRHSRVRGTVGGLAVWRARMPFVRPRLDHPAFVDLGVAQSVRVRIRTTHGKIKRDEDIHRQTYVLTLRSE